MTGEGWPHAVGDEENRAHDSLAEKSLLVPCLLSTHPLLIKLSRRLFIYADHGFPQDRESGTWGLPTYLSLVGAHTRTREEGSRMVLSLAIPQPKTEHRLHTTARTTIAQTPELHPWLNQHAGGGKR